MTTTTTQTPHIETDIQWNIPAMNAETILFQMYSTVREFMEQNNLTFGFGNMMIEKLGGFVAVEVQIDAINADVKYLVAANPDMNQSYPLVDYSIARQELRGYLNSQVVF